MGRKLSDVALRGFFTFTACAFVCDILLLGSWPTVEKSNSSSPAARPPPTAAPGSSESPKVRAQHRASDPPRGEGTGPPGTGVLLLQYPVSLPLLHVVRANSWLNPSLEISDELMAYLSISDSERSGLNKIIKETVGRVNEDELASSELHDLSGGEQCVELRTTQASSTALASLAEQSVALLGGERAGVFMEMVGKPLSGFAGSGIRRQLSLTEFEFNGVNRRNMEIRFLNEKGGLLFSYELPLDPGFRVPSPEFQRYAGVLQKYFPAAAQIQ
jgi:hypothetical protein